MFTVDFENFPGFGTWENFCSDLQVIADLNRKSFEARISRMEYVEKFNEKLNKRIERKRVATLQDWGNVKFPQVKRIAPLSERLTQGNQARRNFVLWKYNPQRSAEVFESIVAEKVKERFQHWNLILKNTDSGKRLLNESEIQALMRETQSRPLKRQVKVTKELRIAVKRFTGFSDFLNNGNSDSTSQESVKRIAIQMGVGTSYTSFQTTHLILGKKSPLIKLWRVCIAYMERGVFATNLDPDMIVAAQRVLAVLNERDTSQMIKAVNIGEMPSVMDVGKVLIDKSGDIAAEHDESARETDARASGKRGKLVVESKVKKRGQRRTKDFGKISLGISLQGEQTKANGEKRESHIKLNRKRFGIRE